MKIQIPGDMVLTEDGTRFVLSSGARLAKERTIAALGTGRESWKFDLQKGFPYRDIFEAIPNVRLIRLLYAEFLSGLPWISVTLSVDAELTERNLVVTWVAETSHGNIEGTVTL